MPHHRSIPRLLATGAALLLAGGCVSRDVSQYVGKDPYMVFPAGQVVDQTLMQLDPARPDADWGLSLVWAGDHYLLTADRNITPGDLQQTWRVRAVQRIPLLKYGQMFAMGDCRRDGVPLSQVVAVVNYDHSERWFDSIDSAWAYDPQRVEFVQYPVAGLECENRLYGTDLTPPPPLLLAPATTAPAPVTIPSPPSH